jgi:NAD-dependent protein deacetylase/lipoamidase
VDPSPPWARDIGRLAVLTGAGISTDSGIPDYRGPTGVWTRNPAAASAFTYRGFMAEPEVRARFWRTYLDHPAWRAEPNAAHQSLVALERSGLGVRILTQNIDGLHVKAGSSPRKVLELHGSMREVVCTRCAARTPTLPLLSRVRAGEYDLRCDCGGILKLGVVMFGEYLDQELFGRATAVARASDLMLAVGSSLQVEPAAGLCRVAVESGAHLVIVNRDPTPYDDLAVEVIREPIGTALPRIVAALTDSPA